ncbi:MAG: hypothetical protein ABF293_13300 [Flavobacteriaceae bacterium]
MIKELLHRAETFEKKKLSHLSTSDRVKASREAKELILAINNFYKQDQDHRLMDIMKQLTVKKRKIEKRLNGKPLV